MFKKAISSRSFWPSLIILAAIIILLLLPNRFANPTYDVFERCRARVISVDNSALQVAGVITYGEQMCTVEVLSGASKGLVAPALNALTGTLTTDKLFEAGDLILVMVGAEVSAGTPKVTTIDYYRLNWELIVVAAFMLFLVVFAGWIGVRSVLAFVFTVLCIWRVLIPQMLTGASPIVLGAVITAVLTAVIIVLVYGIDRRTLAAVAGSLAGTLVTSILAIVFTRLLKINGAVMNYSESLLYSGYSHLNLTEIFIASIFISSSGALMDIAVDITSGVYEVVEANPSVSKRYAIKAGMNIGRAALGTMTTTLLLAYSGSYIGLLMVFVAQGTPLINILNLNFVSAEILNTVIGSFGLVTVAPFAALFSGLLLARRRGRGATPELTPPVEAELEPATASSAQARED